MSHLIDKSSFPNEEWVTSAEIMRFFGITKTTLWRWNQDQQIPRCLIGGTHYYPKNFIQQFMLHKLELPPHFNAASITTKSADTPTAAPKPDVSENNHDTPENNQPTHPH